MTDPDARRAVAALTREVASLRSELKKLSRRPRLGNSSLDNSGIAIKDSEGRLLTTVGKRPDGTFGVGYNIDSTVIRPGGIDTPSLAANAVTADVVDAQSVAAVVGEFVDIHAQNISADISIGTTGSLSGHTISSETDIFIGGTPLAGTLLDPDAEPGIADNMSWGSAAWANFTDQVDGITVNPGGTVTPVGQFMVKLAPNRVYRFAMPWRGYVASTTSDDVHQTINLYMNHATDSQSTPPDPTIDDAYIGSQGQRWPVSPVGISDALVTTIMTDDPASGQPVWYKFLLGIWTNDGTFSPDTDPQRVTMWRACISDMGATPLEATVTPAGSNAVQTFVTTWRATDSASWNQDGTREATYGTDELVYGNTSSGNVWHAAFVCNGTAIIGESKTVDDALAGATLRKAEVYLYNTFWVLDSGQLQMQSYGRDDIPNSYSHGTVGSGAVKWDYSNEQQGRWIEIPTSWISTTSTGVLIGPPDWLGQETRGRFAGATFSDPEKRPRLRLTYTR